MEPNTNQSKSYGAVVASIIIILVLIVGALYFWGKTLEQKESGTTQEPAQVQEQNVQQTDDSVDSIKADLNETQDLKDVDAGLKEI